MAANKFTAKLHGRRTHSITAVLVYAVLEWILILLLLLNSTFSYLIQKFAAYFGLKPPCTWCSRIHQPAKNANFSQDHFCEEHAREISKLGYCSNHQRLADTERFCSDCSSSRTADYARIGFFTWVNGKKDCRCSCCDQSFSKKVDLPCLQFKPSWDFLHHIWKSRVLDDDHKNINGDEDQLVSDTESFSFGPVVEEDCSISVSNFPGCTNEENACQNSSFPEDELQQSCRAQLTASESVEEDDDCISETLISETETRKNVDDSKVVLVAPELGNFPEYEEQKHFSNIASFLEGIDGNVSIEQLRFTVEAQQKALNASYAELEAERSAAAIAASQTMAMISKLQEEKSAMQMEALQYQRMMEEQSEYDQEALQILNDLIIKREKEKQELEKELEIYRKKVSYFEAKDQKLVTTKNDSEGKYNTEHSSVLDKSVTEFEEERISILQELKELEERLLSLADDDHSAEDYEQNLYESYVYSSSERKPLTESIEEAEVEESLVHNSNRLAIMEEFGHVYEKLQALEADKEFLKHCISSLKKGDKGLDLLQEILQNLHDLKSVEYVN